MIFTWDAIFIGGALLVVAVAIGWLIISNGKDRQERIRNRSN